MKRISLLLIFILLVFAAAPPVRADYPIVSQRYLADPGAMVYNGTVYLYCSNDDDNPVNGGYAIKSVVCVSSTDLKNWTDHGVVFQVPDDASWATHSWAPAAIERNGKFYLYFGNGGSGIGVATSSSPTGPFTDPIGGPLITSSTPGVLPASNIWIFDPAVFVDGDGQAYLYFGGNGESNVRIIKLNDDMISTSGSAMALTVPYFFEASWMHERNGVYYFSYSTNPSNGMRIDYLTGSSPTGPFTYQGTVAGQPPDNNNNNHSAIFEFKGNWYFAYHNRYDATQAGIPTTYRRNLGIEPLHYNADGTIQQISFTRDGLSQLGHLDPYTRVEAETMRAQSGITTEPCSEGGMDVTSIDNGDWIEIQGVDFGSAGANQFSVRAASAGSGGTIDLRLGSPTGTVVGTCTVPSTGDGQTWTTVTCPVTGATGVQNLYLTFSGTDSNLFNLNWWEFTANPSLKITLQPRPLTLAPGQRLSLWVTAEGAGSLTYQWMKNGTPISGATSAYYDVASAAAGDAGDYTVKVTDSTGSVTSDKATVTLDATASAHLVNMSVRANVAAGATLIPGFVVSGTTSQQLLLRAVGPSLKGLNVANPLPDPMLTAYQGQTSFLTNDNWSSAANASTIATVAQQLGAFALPSGSKDAAALVNLAPGVYTAHVTGGQGSGVVLLELYKGTGGDARLVNVSARGDIGIGDNVMIPGFVISGTGAMTLLIRAVGPSLVNQNVTGYLKDPTLTIYQGSTPIYTNDDWGDAPDVPALVSTAKQVGAFALDSGSHDAAALVVLMPGAYTAVARGVGGTTGNVLVEVYAVP